MHLLGWGVAGAVILIAVVVLLRPWETAPRAATTQPLLPATTQATTQPGTYFIGGFVERPGTYSMDKPITLRQLILVGGLSGDDKKYEGTAVITREGPDQGEMISVDVGPLIRQNTGDVLLVPNDKVIVRDAKPQGQ